MILKLPYNILLKNLDVTLQQNKVRNSIFSIWPTSSYAKILVAIAQQLLNQFCSSKCQLYGFVGCWIEFWGFQSISRSRLFLHILLDFYLLSLNQIQSIQIVIMNSTIGFPNHFNVNFNSILLNHCWVMHVSGPLCKTHFGRFSVVRKSATRRSNKEILCGWHFIVNNKSLAECCAFQGHSVKPFWRIGHWKTTQRNSMVKNVTCWLDCIGQNIGVAHFRAIL